MLASGLLGFMVPHFLALFFVLWLSLLSKIGSDSQFFTPLICVENWDCFYLQCVCCLCVLWSSIIVDVLLGSCAFVLCVSRVTKVGLKDMACHPSGSYHAPQLLL